MDIIINALIIIITELKQALNIPPAIHSSIKTKKNYNRLKSFKYSNDMLKKRCIKNSTVVKMQIKSPSKIIGNGYKKKLNRNSILTIYFANPIAG